MGLKSALETVQSKTVTVRHSLPLGGLTFLLLLFLKLGMSKPIPWFWVFFPLWISLAVVLGVALAIGAVMLVGYVIFAVIQALVSRASARRFEAALKASKKPK